MKDGFSREDAKARREDEEAIFDPGLLISFGAATFKEGVKRIVNGHQNFASSRLRVSPSGIGSPELLE